MALPLRSPQVEELVNFSSVLPWELEQQRAAEQQTQHQAYGMGYGNEVKNIRRGKKAGTKLVKKRGGGVMEVDPTWGMPRFDDSRITGVHGRRQSINDYRKTLGTLWEGYWEQVKLSHLPGDATGLATFEPSIKRVVGIKMQLHFQVRPLSRS